MLLLASGLHASKSASSIVADRMRHLYLQWGAHAVVDCAREVLLEHGGTLMGYMVMVPTLYMATTGSAVRMSGAAGVSAAGRRLGPRLLTSGVQAIATHGDHSHGNNLESPLALLFGAGAMEDDHAHGNMPQYRCRLGCILLKTAAILSLTGHGDDAHGHSHGGVGDIAVICTMIAGGLSGLHSSSRASNHRAPQGRPALVDQPAAA